MVAEMRSHALISRPGHLWTEPFNLPRQHMEGDSISRATSARSGQSFFFGKGLGCDSEARLLRNCAKLRGLDVLINAGAQLPHACPTWKESQFKPSSSTDKMSISRIEFRKEVRAK